MDFKSPLTLQCVLMIIIMIDAVNVSSHIDGGRELLCESANRSRVCFHWMLNGQLVGLIEIEDDGKKIILEKGLPGKLVCQIHHENNIGESSLIELECKEGDLLKQPLFLYTLAACGGGAIVLAVIASLITFCCLKSKQQFIPVPSEEEKEEGLTMSVISNEETKSPPNGDHHEALSAPDDSPPNPGSANEIHKAYGVLGGSVFLNVPGFKVENQHEITWLKTASILVKVKNSTVKYYREKEKYTMFPNGTLRIDRLVKEDGGSYTVRVYNDTGLLQVEENLNVSFQEIVSKPEIKWVCSQNSMKVTCEVNQRNEPLFHLFRNNKTLNYKPPIDANGIWKIEYSSKSSTAKFQCEVKNHVSKKTADQEIKCSVTLHYMLYGIRLKIRSQILYRINSFGFSEVTQAESLAHRLYLRMLDIVLIGSIAGGAVVFVIFLALLIYCIRKKRAERYEEQDEEIPMKIRQAGDESKYRELPQPPVHAPQKQPRQQQRLPPQSQTQYQAGPPRPRPRTQQKSPSHMKERP
ncbi:T-cell surface antigen CD2 [Chelonia mydas]|uniref:T-cell surface antigen CD2 n=1 Tax=Chelonia mydas TaxID=8469 RepID=M7BJ17_CHEMY|nr:T-cell surface antigen CD2 [Chelonia mydas]